MTPRGSDKIVDLPVEQLVWPGYRVMTTAADTAWMKACLSTEFTPASLAA